MRAKILVPWIWIMLTLSGGCVGAGEVRVQIIAPLDGSVVPERPIVEGRVSNASDKVWVVVHPLEVSDYWVQPHLEVRADGVWKVQVHIGRPGNVDVGKAFEIRAVANPESELREGNVLPDWPRAGALSDIIEVTRK